MSPIRSLNFPSICRLTSPPYLVHSCTVNLIFVSEGLYITSIIMANQCQQPIKISIALIWYHSDNVEMSGKFEIEYFDISDICYLILFT